MQAVRLEPYLLIYPNFMVFYPFSEYKEKLHK